MVLVETKSISAISAVFYPVQWRGVLPVRVPTAFACFRIRCSILEFTAIVAFAGQYVAHGIVQFTDVVALQYDGIGTAVHHLLDNPKFLVHGVKNHGYIRAELSDFSSKSKPDISGSSMSMIRMA